MANTVNQFAIHLERSYPTTPDAIYKLLINGAKFGDVTGIPGKGGGTEGAFFSIFGDFVTGRQIELVPNERISQAWRMMDWVPGQYSIVRFTFVQEGRHTRFVVDQAGHPEEFHEHISTNWEGFYFRPFEKYFGEIHVSSAVN
ncbi:MAG: SRPBCC domain-containing protein [Saprospiraceae bacterium]